MRGLFLQRLKLFYIKDRNQTTTEFMKGNFKDELFYIKDRNQTTTYWVLRKIFVGIFYSNYDLRLYKS